MEALERYSTSNDLPTLLIILVLLLLVLAKQLFQHRFEDFTSLFNSNKFLTVKSKEHKALYGFNVILFFVHTLVISLSLFVLYRIFVTPAVKDPGIVILRIFTAYSFFVLLKITVEKIIANVFGIDETADHYLFHKHTYRNFISLLLFPITVFLIYADSPGRGVIFAIISIFIAATFYSFFQLLRKNEGIVSRNWFYFILYLCALEISPYVILYKLITTS